MRHLKSGLTVAVLTFTLGAYVDSHLRYQGRSAIADCFCSSAGCRIALVADHPILALSHPVETLELLADARRTD